MVAAPPRGLPRGYSEGRSANCRDANPAAATRLRGLAASQSRGAAVDSIGELSASQSRGAAADSIEENDPRGEKDSDENVTPVSSW